MAMTLEELKAQNAAEAAEPETIPQIVPEAVEQTTEEEGNVDPLQVAEPSEDGALPETLESWQDEGDAEVDLPTFTNGDVAAAKRKLRSKLEREHTEEVSKLQAEIQQLQQAGSPANEQKPKRDAFYDAEDPEEAYLDALSDWKINQKITTAESRNQQLQAAQQQQQQQQEIESKVSQHYAKAEKLIADSGISEDMYRAADKRVRATIDAMIPGGGDSVTDALISHIGDGSEKVLYNLGVNKSRMNDFINVFKSDPSGIKAAVYLGELKANLGKPSSKKTNAPTPAPSLIGDASTQVDKAGQEYRKRYQSAHSSNDVQAAFNARSEARAAGVDVSNW